MSASYTSISPNDTAPLPSIVRAVYVGVSGDITAVGAGSADAAVTFKSVPQGWNTFPSPIVKVLQTGTTATNLVGAAF